jgi:hypothetical protein
MSIRQRYQITEVQRERGDGTRETLCGSDLRELPPFLEPDLLGLGLEPYLASQPLQVELLREETRWYELPEGSAGDHVELRLGGKIGRLVYGLGAARFYPILRAGEVLHAGKNPAAGCGRIRVSLPEP